MTVDGDSPTKKGGGKGGNAASSVSTHLCASESVVCPHDNLSDSTLVFNTRIFGVTYFFFFTLPNRELLI